MHEVRNGISETSPVLGLGKKKTNLISGWSFLLDGEQLIFILERLSPEAPERGKIFDFLGQLNGNTSIITVLDN